jgi:hypothetical protein
MGGIFFIILAVIIVCSYLTARKVFLIFQKRNNKWALLLGIAAFILSFSLISIALIFVAVSLEDDFGR